ncbi:MAG: acetyl-CoA hydrolase/transferase C-terminal domain-containing protein [Ignavibacteriaceae bacterium]|nr:acetyl-CoA hydrolase/transferase C-terminal domain-containing protein [Ignavibacteriaceae bacterium]
MKWIDTYKSKLCTPEEAASYIKSDQKVYIHPGCAIPEVLVEAMTRRYKELWNVEIFHILTFGIAPYIEPEMEGHFRHNALFIGSNVRSAVNAGRADFTPIFLSEVPSLFQKKIIPIDVALIHVSPPDKYGFCSYGIGVECTKIAAENAKFIIAQINPNMPRTLGNSFIHIDKFDKCIEADVPLKEMNARGEDVTPEEYDIFQSIGSHIADLIEDGSTLQLGIGAIPDSVLGYLGHKKDLGIHTEMFSDGLIKLIEDGVVTNELKTLHQGKLITSFVLGSKKLYDFLDDNSFMEFHPTNYVNDPFIIAQNDKMIAINSAVEVDITGQVCADSIGSKLFSGFGGQVDFVRGATRSKGGKPIIALPSTAKKGEVSRIVPFLKRGAGITTSRGDVHYVITEFGVADLYGKSIRQRAKALINIAHPKFREELDTYLHETYLKKSLIYT